MNTNFIDPGDFSEFTYSKRSHFQLFDKCDYDVELFGEKFDYLKFPLKRYQDLLVFSFIKQMIPGKSRLLEVGGGHSRIIMHFKKNYECWNVDKLEGCGQGPTSIEATGFRLVKDYMGNFNQELPSNYFDFVFSISALEHVPQSDPELFERILKDMNRVLKPNCYSLHCFDSIVKADRLWVNPLLHYIFEREKTLNSFIPFEDFHHDPDLFTLPEKIYNERWLPVTKETYRKFGKPISYNVLWKKQ